jgi:hypothetical protein
MFGCCPRHHVRMLVPERGEPTKKIGLFIVSCNSTVKRDRDSNSDFPTCRSRFDQIAFVPELEGQFPHFVVFRF